jgi:serine/threonine-protein kinase
VSNHVLGTQTWADAIATDFDRDCRAGKRPRIEDYVAGAVEPRRSHLLAELLRVEMEHRRETGEEPTAGEYEQRFPEHGELIRELFAELRGTPSETVLDHEDVATGRDPCPASGSRWYSNEGPEQFSGEFELIGRILRAAASAEAQPPLGFVGKYVLLEKIGGGSQGTVYRALENHPIAPREVAMKLLRAGPGGSPADANRFIDEVRTLAYIEHRHIVPYLDSGEDRSQLYYVMPLMRGGSLAHFLEERREPLDPDEAAQFMIQIAEAVHYLHSQPRPILHRDLKPQNVFRDAAGRLYIGDFGLATLLMPDGSLLQGGTCGTPGYIPPEQLDGRFGEVGLASDIYTLGVILYELITRQAPYPHTSDWPSLIQTLDRNPVHPSRVRPGIPEPLERICLKCLQKMTTSRYRSAEELMEDLEAFRKGDPLPNTPPSTAWQSIRDWARSEPALAARLGVIVACSIIIWGYRLCVGYFAPIAADDWLLRLEIGKRLWALGLLKPVIVCLNQAILVAWGLASWAFQRQLTRSGQESDLQFGWRAVDVLVLSLLILLDDALMSPLTVAFAVLIVASAFWARADQVLQTTLLSMCGYFALILAYRLGHLDLPHAYRHFHYLVALGLLGLMLTHQVNRTRALAHICDARNR